MKGQSYTRAPLPYLLMYYNELGDDNSETAYLVTHNSDNSERVKRQRPKPREDDKVEGGTDWQNPRPR